jgi:hypothetical protein
LSYIAKHNFIWLNWHKMMSFVRHQLALPFLAVYEEKMQENLKHAA